MEKLPERERPLPQLSPKLCPTSSCSPFQTNRLLLSSTRFPGHQEVPEGLLASSFQPGLDSCLLHILPHQGLGEQLSNGVCSQDPGLRTTQRQMSHPCLPTQVLPSLAAGGTSSHYSPVFRSFQSSQFIPQVSALISLYMLSEPFDVLSAWSSSLGSC